MRKTLLWHLICVLACSAAVAAQEDDPRLTPVVLAYRRAKPAVVNISTKTIRSVRTGFLDDDIFSNIFPYGAFRRRVPVRSIGSGFVLHGSGYVVTNAHVVRRADKITVTTHDAREYPAKVISADSENDLAVLKIDLPAGATLPHLPLGRSDDLMVGETIIAIGNPLGYANTLTTGVISALNRTREFAKGVRYSDLIQIDAPINPGNSGGPLLNVKGQLIGVNTAIRADAQNIGFAIAVDTLTEQLGNLLDFERINRVVFGAKVVQRHGPGGPEVLVASVAEGTPAAGRLRVGDRLTSLDGVAVRQLPDFTCAMLAKTDADSVSIGAVRGSEQVEVEVPIVPKPRPDGRKLAERLLGMSLREITPQLAEDLRLPVDAGLLVVGLADGGPAAALGLELKDILFQVGNFYVKDLETLGIILEDIGPHQAVRIGVARGNTYYLTSIRTSGSSQ